MKLQGPVVCAWGRYFMARNLFSCSVRSCKSDVLDIRRLCSLYIIKNPGMWSCKGSTHSLFLRARHVLNFAKIIYNYFCQVPSKSRHINVPIPLDLLPSGTFTSRPFFTTWAHERSENECSSLKSQLCLIKIKSCLWFLFIQVTRHAHRRLRKWLIYTNNQNI